MWHRFQTGIPGKTPRLASSATGDGRYANAWILCDPVGERQGSVSPLVGSSHCGSGEAPDRPKCIGEVTIPGAEPIATLPDLTLAGTFAGLKPRMDV